MRASTLKERAPVVITASVLLLLVVIAGLKFENFVTLRVFANLVTDNAHLGVVAVGLTFVILTGGIDLSVGSMVGLSSIMVAKLAGDMHWHPVLAVVAPLVAGAVLGLGQGLLIAKYSLPPFLVTLAGLFLCRGLALWISHESLQIKDPTLASIATWSLPLPGRASLTVPAIVFVVVLIAAIFVARQTKFGRAIYAAGGNAASARLMGLPVDRTIVLAYVVSAMSAALGGVIFTIYTSSGNAISGTGLELDAITAVVIGGTLLSGGYGSVFGTMLGIFILGVVQTAISFDGSLSSWWTRIVFGALLFVFMLVQRGIETAAKRQLVGSRG